ncbi:GNAT family N-acetyltransferase [Actinocrispum wychmicini]|uniref:ornithine decarboxylase n=1 Tax=Actinocrispum wychmicini TaxID=1213861 RepID=A0A4R2IQ43_9PSEU|nr:GNAT family N-acetyltransferase [Actinocrispum wychmicini]TCO47353.1 ornithine decarboxylase [Actinocrispum wychmicini]
MRGNARLRAALAAAAEDQIVFDLAGIEEQYDSLTSALPGVAIRFAMKACPVDEVLAGLAAKGAGFDAASPNEIAQALRTGVPVAEVHYGNTIKSDENIAAAYRMGIRDFATDSVEDVTAIAEHAPASRVFCRVATSGTGALWGLSHKCGCSGLDAVHVLDTARTLGLTPAGLSVHVGSQQMTVDAWHEAFDDLAEVIAALGERGIVLDHVNLGGGLPALGYLDRRGRPLEPPIDGMFAAIRAGMRRLREVSPGRLDFVLEPGRHLVADHGAIRAHVSRLSVRHQPWLYLSCGKFNGLYEIDQLRYRLVFPTHTGERIPAVIAGPTCDSDDSFGHEHSLVEVPKAVASGDPVWILSCGAYSTSYTTEGFNGFDPLPRKVVYDVYSIRQIRRDDWDGIVQLESRTYSEKALSEGRAALESRARSSPATCFVLDVDEQLAGYVLALPYPMFRCPDLTEVEQRPFDSRNLHLHDLVIADRFRGGGLASQLLGHLTDTARSNRYERMSLVAVAGSDAFWSANGFRAHSEVPLPRGYGDDAVYMSRSLLPKG